MNEKEKKNRKKKEICFFGWNSLGLKMNIERNIFSKSLRIFLKIFRVTSWFRWGGIEENVACN